VRINHLVDTDQGQAGTSRKRRGSRILFWLVTREFLLPLVCCLLAFSALFLFTNVFDDLDDFLHRAGGAAPGSRWQIVFYFLLLQPAEMLNVLPMSVLLSCCFIISRMGRHHELAAMRATGIHMIQMALPIWIIAALLCGVSFWMEEAIVPQCTVRATQVFEAWTAAPDRARRARALVYRNAPGRRDWFIEAFAPDGKHRGVFIKQFTAENAVAWELRAATASYTDGAWVFEDCEVTPFDPETQLPVEGGARHYDSHRLPELDETPERILNHVQPTDHLSIRGMLATLRANPDLPEPVKRSFRSTICFRISFSLACLVGALFGIALSLTRERSSAMRGFAFAVGLMVAFYVASQLGLTLALRGRVSPLAGACLPTAAFLVAGVVIMYRRR
jgi:lipopolysaccharide export system permease protein